MSHDNKKHYSVGYKRPPAEHRFKPGQSGNPAGRPPGRRSFQSLVQQAADKQIQVTVGSERTTMSIAEAAIHVVLKALVSGNPRAYAIGFGLLERYYSDEDTAPVQDAELMERERALLSEFLEAQRGGDRDPSAD